MNLWMLVLLISPVFIILAVLRNQRARSEVRSATIDIVVDSEGVRRVLADGRREGVTWGEVTEVDVFTTRVGPHKPAGGAVVLYGDHERGCIVPLDKLPTSGLLDQMYRLPGFEIQRVVDAITADDRSGRNGAASPISYLTPKPLQTTTVCWTRPDPVPPDPVPLEAERPDRDGPEPAVE